MFRLLRQRDGILAHLANIISRKTLSKALVSQSRFEAVNFCREYSYYAFRRMKPVLQVKRAKIKVANLGSFTTSKTRIVFVTLRDTGAWRTYSFNSLRFRWACPGSERQVVATSSQKPTTIIPGKIRMHAGAWVAATCIPDRDKEKVQL